MSSFIRVTSETIRSVAEATIPATYVSAGKLGTPLANPSRLVAFTNDTNAAMFVSDDGVNDKFFLAANSFKLFDLTSNRMNVENVFCYATGTQFWVRYASAPSSGSGFYLETLYGA
jgi:hypothetical protein